jgi:hypothetical protein
MSPVPRRWRDLLLRPSVGYRISPRRFSPLRVLVLLLFLGAVIGLFTGLGALVNLPR